MKHLPGKISGRRAVIGVVGLGYVGLPLVREFLKQGFRVIGFDIAREKVETLNRGESYLISAIGPDEIGAHVKAGRFRATHEMSEIAETDVVIMCLPTPLGVHMEPDLSYISNTATAIAQHLRPGTLVSMESTTYPGTSREVLLPILESSGLKGGGDFYLCYSPERENPGDTAFGMSNTPKLVGGLTQACLNVGVSLYGMITKVVPVASLEVAEAAKILENTYRAVNIALVNELKILFTKMGIDVWDVIDAAKTKPFGFHAFYPGPGLGGHCIPIDPYYLTWKAREYELNTRFIELAGEVNTGMPAYCVQKTAETLNRSGKAMHGAKILVLGIAYKPDVDDTRESPGLKILHMLQAAGASISYSDPHVPSLVKTRKFNLELKSTLIEPDTLRQSDCVMLVTDHSSYDYELIFQHAPLIIDTRNAFGKRGLEGAKILKA